MPSDRPSRSRMSPQRLAEVFGAVQELLLEVGYERLTLDAVAARARTSKATLYRQWGSKPGLVMAALRRDDGHQPLFGDAGTASLDEAFAQLARTDLVSDRDVRLGFLLLQAASTDPEFGAALRAEIVAPLVDELAGVFHAAADRGEIARDSPLFRRLASVILTDLAFFPLISGHEASREAREALFRTVVRPALGGRESSAPTPPSRAQPGTAPA